MKFRMAAVTVFAMVWSTSAAAQPATPEDASVTQYKATVAAYFTCINQAVRDFEPSGETASTVAEAAVVQCNELHFRAGPALLLLSHDNRGLDYGEEAILKMAHDQALVLTVRLRADRARATPNPPGTAPRKRP